MRLILVFLLSIFLTACGTSPVYKQIEVIETKVEKVKVPEEFLVSCKPEPFMSSEAYLQLDIPERESALKSYIVVLYKTIKQCDINIDKIKKFQAEEK